MEEFVKWCFRDENSGLFTVIVICVVFTGIAEVIKALRK